MSNSIMKSSVRLGVDGDAPCAVRRGRPIFSRRTAQTLNSGMRETGSSAVLVSRLALPAPPQWNGTNSVSRRMSRRERAPSATSRRAAWSAAPCRRRAMPSIARRVGMDLDERLGLRLGQFRHAAGLRAGLVMRQQPAGGQEERVIAGPALRRRRDARRDGTARGRPRCAKRSRNRRGVPGWSVVRAGPEHAVLGRDPLVGDAGVVGDAARQARRNSSNDRARGRR